MNWKASLDKYLTSPPDDGFDGWCDDILEKQISDAFFNKNEKWLLDNNGLCSKWLNVLFNRNKNTDETAKIIERAFKIYYHYPRE